MTARELAAAMLADYTSAARDCATVLASGASDDFVRAGIRTPLADAVAALRRLSSTDNAATLPHLGATLTPAQAATLLECGAAGPESAETWARSLRGESGSRFRTYLPDAIPWRERLRDEPLASMLALHNATDAEAADVYAYECNRLRRDVMRLIEMQPPAPIVINIPRKGE